MRMFSAPVDWNRSSGVFRCESRRPGRGHHIRDHHQHPHQVHQQGARSVSSLCKVILTMRPISVAALCSVFHCEPYMSISLYHTLCAGFSL